MRSRNGVPSSALAALRQHCSTLAAAIFPHVKRHKWILAAFIGVLVLTGSLELQMERPLLGLDGTLVFDTDSAELHGRRIQAQTSGSQRTLGYWDDFKDYASWLVEMTKPDQYDVFARTASSPAENDFVVELDEQQLAGTPPKTASWTDFVDMKVGPAEIAQAGKPTLNLRPVGEAKKWKVIKLAFVTLKLLR